MPFSRDLSQEQLIGWVNPGKILKLSKACLESEASLHFYQNEL